MSTERDAIIAWATRYASEGMVPVPLHRSSDWVADNARIKLAKLPILGVAQVIERWAGADPTRVERAFRALPLVNLGIRVGACVLALVRAQRPLSRWTALRWEAAWRFWKIPRNAAVTALRRFGASLQRRTARADASPVAGLSHPEDLDEAAQSLARAGFAVLPVRPGTKLPAVQVERASQDPIALAAMFESVPGASVGIGVGPPHGLVVFDLDRSKGGDSSRRFIERWFGGLPPTVRALTRDGEHLYFRWPGGYHRLELLPGFAVVGPAVPGTRGWDPAWGCEAGWVVAPPSPHPAGGCYAWAPGESPFEREIAPLPDRLAGLISQTAETSKSRWLTDHRSARQRLLSLLIRWSPRRVRQTGRIATLAVLAGRRQRRPPDR